MTEYHLKLREYAEEYVSVYGILGSSSLNWATIYQNQIDLWGEIRCSKVINEYINELQIKKIIELKNKGLSNYEIEKQTGFSINKIRKTGGTINEEN